MFKKSFWSCGILALAGVFSVSCVSGRDAELYENGIFVMDTYCDIKISGASPEDIAELLYELDGCFDRYDENSQVSRLNRGENISLSTELGKLIESSLSLQEKYMGGVDITSGELTELWGITSDEPHVPEEQEIKAAVDTIGVEHIVISGDMISLDSGTSIDLGAVAKGYALDCVKALLDEKGAGYGVASMTSSILLYGEKPESEPFRIAVRGAQDGEILGTAEVESCFLSTSGGYERYFTDSSGKTYSHILDPETGYPSETDLTTVTVFCENGLLSDYLSTLIYMGGTASIEEHLDSDEYKLVAADKDGNVYVSDGLIFIEE